MSGLKFKSGGSTPKYKGSGTKDYCYKKAVEIYGPKTSAYRSGYMSRCRKNKMESGGLLFNDGGETPKKKVTSYTAEQLAEALGYRPNTPDYKIILGDIKRNPQKYSEMVRERSSEFTETVLPEVEVKASPLRDETQYSDAARGYMRGKPAGQDQFTKQGGLQFARNRKAATEFTNAAADFVPGFGDVKGIYEALKNKDTAGVALATLGIIPMGDAAKLFKPVIKQYSSNTEMFLDFLKQAEEQGIKVDRSSKLYKQIVDEVPEARKFYTPKNITEEYQPQKNKDHVTLKLKNPEYDSKDYNSYEYVGEIVVNPKTGEIGETEIYEPFLGKRLGDQLYGQVNDYLQNKYGVSLKQSERQVSEGNVSPKAGKLWNRLNEKGIVDTKLIPFRWDDLGVSDQPARQFKPISDEQIADALYLSTKTEQAQKGLGDSKVQDLVYHGTPKNFTQFDVSKLGENTQHPTSKLGIYTAGNKASADIFRRSATEEDLYYDNPIQKKIYDKLEEKLKKGEIAHPITKEKVFSIFPKLADPVYADAIKGDVIERIGRSLQHTTRNIPYPDEGSTMPLLISAKNPHGFEGEQFTQLVKGRDQYTPLIDKILAIGDEQNIDSYVIPESDDIAMWKETLDGNYVVRKPTQVKSPFREHLAKWDWNNPNIHKAVGAGVAAGTAAKLSTEKEKKKQGGIIFKKGGSIFDKESKEGLRGWFGRNKGEGWKDCLSRGPCGGEKAGKKRLCRPTLADCPSKEKVKAIAKKKKMGKPVKWK